MLKEVANESISLTKSVNKFTKSFPKTKGWAFWVSPKYTEGVWTTNSERASMLTDNWEFKFIDFWEDNSIWSKSEFKTNRPEFNIICFPLYSFGNVGGLDG